MAKIAHAQHLAPGRARERGSKGRKLPGGVLQCFKNLSSRSAELSGRNNRFGTWPACSRESVTAALWSGLPVFDGCSVSQNSWRRGTPAAQETEGKTQQTKSQSRGFFVGQTQRRVTCGVVPCTERNRHCCASSHSRRSAREKMQHNPMGKSSNSSLPGGSPSPHGIFPAVTTSRGPSSVDEWVGGHHKPITLSLSQHIKALWHYQGWLNGNSSLHPKMLVSVFGGVCGWEEWSTCLISCTLP